MADEREDSFLRAVAYVPPVDPVPIDTPAIGSVLASKYELLEAIGHGGMAVVFAARHRLTGRRVAVKWMRPQRASDETSQRRLLREARAAGSIDHPNVVAVHDVGTHRNSPYLVMELLEGRTLRSRMRQGPLPTDEALSITQAVIAGVNEAHRRGILHRDIKPDNVFLCERPGQAPLPKVLDFGVSGAVRETSELSTLTDDGTVVGTPGYMPLEQLQGATDLDQRADVYAVGVMLYEMLTGRRPFPARTYADLVVQLATCQPPRPERFRGGLDAGLSDAVMKAIARDRRDRFADLHAMAKALTERRPDHGWPRRAGLALSAAAALALGVLLLSGYLSERAGAAPTAPVPVPSALAPPSSAGRPEIEPATLRPEVLPPPAAIPSGALAKPEPQHEDQGESEAHAGGGDERTAKTESEGAAKPRETRARPRVTHQPDAHAAPPEKPADRALSVRRSDF